MVGIAHNIPEIISPSLKEEIVANKQLIVSMAKNPPTIDKIENLRQYDIVSDKILDFLFNIDENTLVGRYEIDEQSYANIEEYNTKAHENCFFEAHKNCHTVRRRLLYCYRKDIRYREYFPLRQLL